MNGFASMLLKEEDELDEFNTWFVKCFLFVVWLFGRDVGKKGLLDLSDPA